MKTLFYIIIILTSPSLFANDLKVKLNPNISVPKDPVIRNEIMDDLNNFLSQLNLSNDKNSCVKSQHLPETSLLMDELKLLSYDKTSNDSDFYKCYLTNILQLNDSVYTIQLSYSGIKDSATWLRAVINIDTYKSAGKFTFNSPLKRNTSNWQNKKFGSVDLHYKSQVNVQKANEYFLLIESFDKKLNAPFINETFYCCDNFNEVLRLTGIDYKSDYNGRRQGTLSSKENNFIVTVNGSVTPEFKNYDPHDLWHARLHNVVNIGDINKPVDEGSAYLYGGSWGASWKEISEMFRKFAKKNPEADWIKLYNENKVFDSVKSYPLNVDYAINALLVQKIMKENNLSTFIDLLTCGKRTDGNENYFEALYRIVGIKKK